MLAAYAALSLPGILWTGRRTRSSTTARRPAWCPAPAPWASRPTADTYRPAVGWLSEVAPEGATVYAQAGTHPVLESYRRIGELRDDLRPAYLAPIAPEGPLDEEPREDSYFLFLPRQSIYTDQMLALEQKRPLYEYEKGGVSLIRVYSGEAVGETLSIQGAPEPRDVGPANALVVLGGVLAVLCSPAAAAGRGRRRADRAG